ncbi:hypothetical protein FOCC_FOCC015986, partial [Frankliniella occidentalis]
MGDYRTSNILGHVGLENLGFTCFLNAALQCIHNIEEFRQLLLSNYHKVISRLTPLTETLSMLFAEMCKSESSVAPNAFLHVIRKYWVEYNPGTQQDAMDFLSFLLWRIHAEVLESEFVVRNPNIKLSAHEEVLNAWERSAHSAVTSLLGHQLITFRTCGNQYCSYESVTCDTSLILSLDIPKACKRENIE